MHYQWQYRFKYCHTYEIDSFIRRVAHVLPLTRPKKKKGYNEHDKMQHTGNGFCYRKKKQSASCDRSKDSGRNVVCKSEEIHLATKLLW